MPPVQGREKGGGDENRGTQLPPGVDNKARPLATRHFSRRTPNRFAASVHKGCWRSREGGAERERVCGGGGGRSQEGGGVKEGEKRS